MTGGERYMLTAASCLSDVHDVRLFWDDPAVLHQAQQRFGLRLDNIVVKKNIFSGQSSLMKRLSKSYDYDAIIYLSDGSIPILASKKTILHFQFPVEWVDSDTLLSRLKLKNVQKVVCNSEYTKKFIDRKFGIKSIVIYPPISKILRNETEKRENVILTIGRFSLLPNGSDYKKQIMLIDAFKKLVDEGVTDWKFVVVTSFFAGGDNGTSLLQEHAQGYPVEVRANIAKDELDRLYSTSALYWHAAGYGEDLQVHPDWAEHFGISTIEAMSGGCIPVVINAGGQQEIVIEGKNGLLWNTEEELIKKTKKLLRSTDLQDELRSDSKEIDKKYGVERFSREFHKLVS
jgi:glycosyltransferase involved in cell wall biosynthesis